MNKLLVSATLLLTTIATAQTTSYPPKQAGTYKNYITMDSLSIKVGSKLLVGLPTNGNQFMFLTQAGQPVVSHVSGTTATITKLKSIGNSQTGYKMYAYFKGWGMMPIIIDLEMALRSKEVTVQ